MPKIFRNSDAAYSPVEESQAISANNRENDLLGAGAVQHAILNSSHFLTIATDAKGIIQMFNAGAERMLGYKAAEVVNKITPADISDQQEIIKRAKSLSARFDTQITSGNEALVFNALRGSEDMSELTYICKDGSHFPALVSVTPLRDDQYAIIGYLFNATDNSAYKEAQAEQALLHQALQVKNSELHSASFLAENTLLAKSEFLSAMSQELSIPLNAMLGYAQLLKSDSMPSSTLSQNEIITQINNAGQRQLALIISIHNVAKAESGKISMSPVAVSLFDVLHECRGMVESLAQQRAIKLIFPLYDMWYFVQADRSRIKQALVSLLSNAIQYNREQGTVEVEYTESTPGRIRVSIMDTGAGLHPEQRAQIFQAFNHAGSEPGGVIKTGLITAKRLIEMMDGSIGVESTVGTGSVFWFELNASADPHIFSETGSATTLAKPHRLRGAGIHTILYVEDNPASMQLIKQLISRQPDIRLLTAENGNGGIEMARASRPDVILMDINLPDMSGFKALEVLRSDPATAHIPVIALSANNMPINIDSGLQAGFFRYITKPIKLNELMHALDLALEFSQKNQQSQNKRP